MLDVLLAYGLFCWRLRSTQFWSGSSAATRYISLIVVMDISKGRIGYQSLQMNAHLYQNISHNISSSLFTGKFRISGYVYLIELTWLSRSSNILIWLLPSQKISFSLIFRTFLLRLIIFPLLAFSYDVHFIHRETWWTLNSLPLQKSITDDWQHKKAGRHIRRHFSKYAQMSLYESKTAVWCILPMKRYIFVSPSWTFHCSWKKWYESSEIMWLCSIIQSYSKWGNMNVD